MVQLGPFSLDHPFLLAPMAGITTSPFRRLMRKMDSAIVISDLISANGWAFGSQRTREMFHYLPDERILGFQIFGERPENLVRTCQYVEEIGADFVDLNLGCPVPKVVKRGAGSAMCRNPAALGKILAEMKKSVKIPLTIKIRMGWTQEERNAHEVVQAAADAGVSWVAIHGRSRAQGYSGQADWDYIAEVKAKAAIPIIGNGDITTPEMAVHHYKKYGVDAVMIGRGALRNPFIFSQAHDLWSGKSAKHPSGEDFIQLMLQQRQFLEEMYPDPSRAIVHARKFLSWYSSGLFGCHEFRKQVFSIKDPEQLWQRAHDFFTASAAQRDWSFLSQPFLMGGHG